jgi:hypothetical protein
MSCKKSTYFPCEVIEQSAKSSGCFVKTTKTCFRFSFCNAVTVKWYIPSTGATNAPEMGEYPPRPNPASPESSKAQEFDKKCGYCTQ